MPGPAMSVSHVADTVSVSFPTLIAAGTAENNRRSSRQNKESLRSSGRVVAVEQQGRAVGLRSG